MTMPDSVPARAYVLAYNVERGRLGGRAWLSYTLRGAALADLWATGHLTDADGRPRVGPRRPADPVLAAVWSEIADGDPHSWERWVNRRRAETSAAVRHQLAGTRTIRVLREPTWWRGSKIELTDSRVRTRLEAQVAAILRGPAPVGRLDPRDVALIAVLVAGEVNTGVSKTQRHERADRVAAILERGGPAITGLKRAIRTARAARSAS